MPSHQIHLAIAKRYIEKHEVEDKEAFIEGSIAPDFVKPKEISHYTIPTSKEDLLEHLKAKVDINRFLKENKIETDYDKGMLLHLITDKIFFTEFFSEEFLKSTNYHEFTEDLYTSYGKMNGYLEEKYHIILKEELAEKIRQEIEESKKHHKVTAKVGKNIVPLEELDMFIEKMSDVNLEEYCTEE